MYQAFVNVPGYLPQNDEIPEFDFASQAWEHLASERQRDLEDDMNDEADSVDDDQALEEMDDMAEREIVGTVWGRTPGYDGDHDLGLSYTVVRTEQGPKTQEGQEFCAWASMPANQPGWEI